MENSISPGVGAVRGHDTRMDRQTELP